MTSDPDIPLLAMAPQRTLRDWASASLPELNQDGLKLVAQVTEDRGTTLAGAVQWRDLSAGAVFTREVTGERTVAGVIEWKF